MNNKYKLIIWDFDGVIADSEKVWLKNRQIFFKERLGLDFSFEQINQYFGGTSDSTKKIILDRKLVDKRLFPTIDITRSGTRKEELLVDRNTLTKMWVLRRVLMQMGLTDGMEFLLDKLRISKDNADFFNNMNS